MYPTTNAEDVAFIVANSGSRVVFAEDQNQVDKLVEQRSKLSAVTKVVIFDGSGDGDWVITLDELENLGKELLSESPSAVSDRVDAITSDQLATLIYTSGTTGRPKGCELTHLNFIFEAENIVASVPEVFADPECSTLLFLPLAHVFGRIIQIACLHAKVPLGHTADVTMLVDDLGAFRPSFVLAVPRVFEKIYNGAQQRAIASGKGKIFDRATATARTPRLKLRLVMNGSLNVVDWKRAPARDGAHDGRRRLSQP